jgi:hypothetical protein
MIVYVVLWANYGDQGYDLEGVFSTLKAANEFIKKRSEEVNDHPSNWFVNDCKILGEVMSKKIDVYVNGQNQPQHLAVMNEQKHYLPAGSEPAWRAICGLDVTGLEVNSVEHKEVKLPCKDCDGQLKIWREVHAEGYMTDAGLTHGEVKDNTLGVALPDIANARRDIFGV